MALINNCQYMTAASSHPTNAALRAYLLPRLRAGLPELMAPGDVARPYDTLGTHPDLVARLWDELGRGLPEDCRRIFCGTPVLMHPASGIVFAFAQGTHTYALRVPEPERTAALAAGATRVVKYPGNQGSLDLDTFGPEWVFGRWLKGEPKWCASAHAFAA